jgi:DNA-binding NarL/FixJ family response regulator
LLDRDGRVSVVSRNEEEALVSDVLGRRVADMVAPGSRQQFLDAFEGALKGREVQVLLAGVADAGFLFWGRVHFMRSPEDESPVLFHMRRLPRRWGELSDRERAVIQALNSTGMNSKRAARRLGISLNTINTHRRSICRKCNLRGVGEFWVFIQQCR